MRAQLSFILSEITRLTDRQTDGQTDTFLIASPRWHSVQRAKSHSIWWYMGLPN